MRIMTDGAIPDTTIRGPSMTGSEVDMPLFALDRFRAQFASKCGRLDATGLSKPHPAKFTIRSGQSPNLRRMLVDLHDEYARHADLLREAVDGLVGEDPPQT